MGFAMRAERSSWLTSVTIFDKLPPSQLLRFRDKRAMTKSFFPSVGIDGNLEQIAGLVDSGKLESGL
jgi:hypothetical protein